MVSNLPHPKTSSLLQNQILFFFDPITKSYSFIVNNYEDTVFRNSGKTFDTLPKT